MHKKLLWGGLAVLGVILLVLAVILINFDGEALKRHLIEQVRDQKQRELQINGPLSLELFPRLGVDVSDIRLSGFKSDAEFLSLGGLKGSVEILPLLRGHLVVNRIEVRDLSLNLERHADGGTNYADLLSASDSEASALQLDIEKFTLLGGAVRWKDGMTGKQIALSDVFLKTGAVGLQAQGRLEMGGKLTSVAPAVQVNLQLDTLYRLDLQAGTVQLENAKGWLKGEGYGLTNTRLDLSSRKLKLDAKQFGLDVEQLLLQGGGDLQGQQVSLKLDAPALAVHAKGAGGERLSADVSLQGGGRQFAAQLSLTGFESTPEGVAVRSVQAHLNLKQADLQATGKIGSPLSYTIASQRLDLPALQGELELLMPDLLLKPLKSQLAGKARLELANSKAAGDFELRLDESRLQGDWRLEQMAPLDAYFTASLDQINLNDYLKPSPAAGAARQDKSPPSGKPAAGAGGGLDPALRLQGSVKVGKLQFRKVKVDNLETRIHLRGGRLELNPLSAQFYEGRLAGMAALGPSPGQLLLRQQLSNVAFNPLLRDLMEKDFLSGRGDLRVEVTARGSDAKSLQQSLNGTGGLRVRDGAVKGINLAKTLRQAQAGLQGKSLSQAASKDEQTDFSELSASFRIQDGLLSNDDLQMKSPFLRLTGQGQVDLGREQMDYLARVNVVETSKGQGGKELTQLRGVTLPVRIRGPFDKIAYELDFSSLLKDSLKSKVEEKLKTQAEERGGGKVDKVLRGLFK